MKLAYEPPPTLENSAMWKNRREVDLDALTLRPPAKINWSLRIGDLTGRWLSRCGHSRRRRSVGRADVCETGRSSSSRVHPTCRDASNLVRAAQALVGGKPGR